MHKSHEFLFFYDDITEFLLHYCINLSFSQSYKNNVTLSQYQRGETNADIFIWISFYKIHDIFYNADILLWAVYIQTKRVTALE